MPTEKQIEANRRNSQKSTGPRTPEGRAAVRLNGVTHGLTAATLVLPGEDKSDFAALLADLEAEHQPAAPTEEVIVRQMALASWRLRRVYHLEAAVFSVRLQELEEDFEEDYERKLKNVERQAKVVLEDTRRTRSLDHLSRYESRLERSFYRALHELQRLRAQRQSEMQNQTQSAPVLPLQIVDPPLDAIRAATVPSFEKEIRHEAGANWNHAGGWRGDCPAATLRL